MAAARSPCERVPSSNGAIVVALQHPPDPPPPLSVGMRRGQLAKLPPGLFQRFLRRARHRHAAFHRLEIAVSLRAPQIAELDILPLRKPRAAVREMDRMGRLPGP